MKKSKSNNTNTNAQVENCDHPQTENASFAPKDQIQLLSLLIEIAYLYKKNGAIYQYHALDHAIERITYAL